VNGESIRTASPRWALLQVGVWTGVGVNGRFIHRAANVVDLLISGEEEPIGTTDNHPFWSEDRQEYVPAGELRVGENLRTVNGSQTYVQSIRPRGPPEDVYNLEVEGAHTYHVGTTGVLVHNSCGNAGGKTSSIHRIGKEGEEAANIVKNTTRIPSLTGKSKFRIPDELSDTGLKEIKNVKYQHLSSQILDSLYFALTTGRRMTLVVRKDTKLSADLMELITRKIIDLEFLP